MNDTVSAPVRAAGEGAGEGGTGPVTYAIKVLSQAPGEGGRPTRTVLFRRTSREGCIEISAVTDAEDLFGELPRLLDAALSLQRAVTTGPRAAPSPAATSSQRLAEESRLVRRLFEG